MSKYIEKNVKKKFFYWFILGRMDNSIKTVKLVLSALDDGCRALEK